MRTLTTVAAGAFVLLLVLVVGAVALIGGAITQIGAGQPAASRVDLARVPPLAAQMLPDLEQVTAATCPQVPVPWLVALIQTESSWNPSAYNSGGRAAGLVQMTEPSWREAGGAPWAETPPPADVFSASAHLRLAVPWICGNFHTVTEHLAQTGKPTAPLDALLVCHIAGCSRVLESRSGVPEPGEAGCGADCAATIRHYITTVNTNAAHYAAPAVPAATSAAGLPRPQPFTGAAAGCVEDDPTGADGCLTAATAHALRQVQEVFGPPGPTTPIRSVSCWDEHAWNPDSDHPDGRACDIFPTAGGQFPAGQELAHGWLIAAWLRTYADDLGVNYLIWQGRFWSPTTPDDPGGWGRPYTGGGVYDARDATGGHYDHIHFSIAV